MVGIGGWVGGWVWVVTPLSRGRLMTASVGGLLCPEHLCPAFICPMHCLGPPPGRCRCGVMVSQGLWCWPTARRATSCQRASLLGLPWRCTGCRDVRNPADGTGSIDRRRRSYEAEIVGMVRHPGVG